MIPSWHISQCQTYLRVTQSPSVRFVRRDFIVQDSRITPVNTVRNQSILLHKQMHTKGYNINITMKIALTCFGVFGELSICVS